MSSKSLSIGRRESLRAAWDGREELPPPSTGPHSGPFGIDYLSSPLFKVASGKRDRKRKVVFDPNEKLRNQSKKRRVNDPEPHLKAPAEVESDVLHNLERKWNCILLFEVARAKGEATHALADELGEQWLGVGGRTVRNWSKRVEKTGSLLREPGSGAPNTVSNRPDILEFFEKKALEWEYEFTFEAMTEAVREKFDVGSTTTVKSIMDHLEWRKTRRVIRPFLTLDHMKERLLWSSEWINFDFFGGSTALIAVDESCFYGFESRGKICYCPPGVNPEPLYALSKTQIPWCMFFGAVSPPRPEYNLDGKIGCWHVGEEKTALRTSKFHEKGEVYWVNVNMDGDVFVELCKTKLIPAIVEKCQWAKEAIVQLDSAGGHRIKSTIEILNEYGKKQKPPICFRTQPTRSPDTNALDLGIWHSMKSRVHKVRYDRNAEESMNQRIINAVDEMWDNYPGTEKLTAIFQTLLAVHSEIIAANGGNSFKQPRKMHNDD